MRKKNEANIQPSLLKKLTQSRIYYMALAVKNFLSGHRRSLSPEAVLLLAKKESWPLGIEVQFSEHVKSNHSVFSGNQSECQT